MYVCMYVCMYVWPLAQNHCQNGLFSLRASHFLVWTEYLVFEPPEGHFKVFLAPGPKQLQERLFFIAREPFFGLDRISRFWSLQKAVLRHFWLLAQNHCQNNSFSLRASHLSVCLDPPEGRFKAFLAPSPKPLPEQPKSMARERFFVLVRISGFWTLQKAVLNISSSWPKIIARTAQKYGAQAIFRSGPISAFGSWQGKAKYAKTN